VRADAGSECHGGDGAKEEGTVHEVSASAAGPRDDEAS
jgi:hypothetical protein